MKARNINFDDYPFKAGDIPEIIIHGDLPNTLLGQGVFSGLPVLHGPSAELFGLGGFKNFHSSEGITWNISENLCFAVGSYHAKVEELEFLAYSIYKSLLNEINHQKLHLLRIWNIIPKINEHSNGEEHYQSFCAGRAQAYSEAGLGNNQLPAASAIGGSEENCLVYLLASPHAGIPVENPRQVSAYDYPPQYGRRSPSFSRGLCWNYYGSEILFISGTASILNHASCHLGNVKQQCLQSLDNIMSLASEASKKMGVNFQIKSNTTWLKIYIRYESDLEMVLDVVTKALGHEMPLMILKADICRKELLVEIEGLCVGSDK